MLGESHNGTQNATNLAVLQMYETISLTRIWGRKGVDLSNSGNEKGL